MDVDGDGVLDILVGVVENKMMTKFMSGKFKSTQDLCKDASKQLK